MQKRWAHVTDAGRPALRHDLEAFIAAESSDGPKRLAQTLLAWLVLDDGDLDAAAKLATGVRAGPLGATRDLASVVLGAVRRRRGEPRGAFVELSAFSGKLLDPWATRRLNAELVGAALEATDWALALGTIEAWLGDAVEEDRSAVRASAQAALGRIPDAELISLLVHRNSSDPDGLSSLVIQSLASRARDTGDSRLAQQLLGLGGSLLGRQGAAVATLARQGGAPKVAGRTVGLLLAGGGGAASRRRSAEVAVGMAAGLGLPGSGQHLVVREDQQAGGIDAALEALIEEGAGVLVAGVTMDHARAASAYAERYRVPILLLEAVEGSGDRVFSLGLDLRDEAELLERALEARGVQPIATFAEGDDLDAGTTILSCGLHGLESPIPRARGLIVLGDSPCLTRLATEFGGRQPRPVFAGGLMSWSPTIARDFATTAGRYPINADTTEWVAWTEARGSLPNWWTALGHDAAALARLAVEPLPDDPTEDPAEIEVRRRRATEALAGATADLWTTEARGFAGGRTLARSLRVIER